MTDYKRAYAYAQMANNAYEDRPQAPRGWSVLPNSVVKDHKTGFAACAFQHPSTKAIVIAYRGTDGIKDIPADKAISGLLGSHWDAQFTQGLDYAKRIMDAHPEAAGRISVTGHSLGGSLAQVSSQMFGFPGATFDPGGAENLVQSAEFKQWAKQHGLPAQGLKTPSRFDNFIVNKSAVSNLSGQHVGNNPDIAVSGTAERSTFSNAIGSAPYVRVGGLVGAGAYAASQGYDQLQRHSMDRIQEVFKTAAQTGYLNQIGQTTTNTPSTDIASLEGLHKVIGEGLEGKRNVSEAEHENLAAYAAKKIQRQGFDTEKYSRISHEHFNGREFLHFIAKNEFDMLSIDVNKGAKIPAEQSLQEMQEQIQQENIRQMETQARRIV